MAFQKMVWIDVPDPNNPPSVDDIPERPTYQTSVLAMDAENLNRIEGGINENQSNISSNTQEIDKIKDNFVRACDFTRKIYEASLESKGTIEWTATEDCWISGYADSSFLSCSVNFYIDDVLIHILRPYRFDSTYSTYGYPDRFPPSIFVKMGSVIKMYGYDPNDYSFEAALTVYGCRM